MENKENKLEGKDIVLAENKYDIELDEKIETRPMNKKYFQDTIAGMQLQKKNFSIITGTSTTRIQIEKEIYVFHDVRAFSDKGFHICRYVKKDVAQFIEDNPDYNYKDTMIDESEFSSVNHDQAVANVGRTIYSVDVNDCYWDTIHKLGFISQKTYNNGLREKKWKTGRNASIGMLKKDEWEHVYVNGVFVETRPVYNDPRMVAIRMEIMSYVHSMFLELMNLIENKHIMYFTDCLYVADYGTALKCMKFFESKGYGSKIGTYELDKIENSTIYWHDYKKNIAKFRRYGNGSDGVTYTIGKGSKITQNKQF